MPNRSPAILPVLTVFDKPSTSVPSLKRKNLPATKLPILPKNLNESSLLPVHHVYEVKNFKSKVRTSAASSFPGQLFTAVPPNVHLHNQLQEQYSDENIITTIDKLLQTVGTCVPVGASKLVPGMKEWCNQNCNHVPRNCPKTHCKCF